MLGPTIGADESLVLEAATRARHRSETAHTCGLADRPKSPVRKLRRGPGAATMLRHASRRKTHAGYRALAIDNQRAGPASDQALKVLFFKLAARDPWV